MAAERKQFFFSDYAFLNSLKRLPTGRFCELAILRELSMLGYSLPKPYSHDEHDFLWSEIKALFAAKGESGTVTDCLWRFLTQLSPKESEILPNDWDHVSHYVKLAVEIAENLPNPATTLELGANQGILSLTLSLMGHTVLCTDIHHGLISSSIESYKMGTWFREHFIGLASVDFLTYPADNTEYLNVFEGGLDAVVCRGTGLLNTPPPPE